MYYYQLLSQGFYSSQGFSFSQHSQQLTNVSRISQKLYQIS